MQQVRGFVKENRGALTRNIAGLNQISKVLVKRRDALDKSMHYAPAALNNLFLANNAKNGTLDTRNNAGQFESSLEEDPMTALCTLIGKTPPCSEFAAALALPRPRPFPGDPSTQPRVPEPIDRSLGGLVEVNR
jgi:ABC-type transporter Mla subunit MlaD